MDELKGNRYVAFGILLVSILLGLALIKPIFIGVIWLIGWVLQGILAFLTVGLFIIGGFCLYRIEQWAVYTLFTNKEPDFPELGIDGLRSTNSDICDIADIENSND
jgi:hypothetical protein